MTTADRLEVFAVCAPGLERLAAGEIAAVDAEAVRAVDGGVEFGGDLRTLYRVNLECGCISHVRVRVARFEARHFSALAKHSARVDWGPWIDPRRPLDVRATSKRSKLYHTGGISQRVSEAIRSRLGGEAANEGPAAIVHARLLRDHCELSVDVSGEALHRRGWRLQTAKAPLREDLAYALLRGSGWDASMSLLDPLMGSGTIIIEAARIAMGIPPGWGRSFAFEHMPNFDAEAWQGVRDRAAQRQHPSSVSIIGRDRERGALEAAKGNAERAGVLEVLTLRQASLDESFEEVAAVITNPPYGKRVGRGNASEVRATWQALGQAIRRAESIETVALVTPDRGLAKLTGLPLSPRLLTDHGGLKVEFVST